MVTSVELIGAPGAWVGLGGVHVLDARSGALSVGGGGTYYGKNRA